MNPPNKTQDAPQADPIEEVHASLSTIGSRIGEILASGGLTEAERRALRLALSWVDRAEASLYPARPGLVEMAK
jgi:hypothetical protein